MDVYLSPCAPGRAAIGMILRSISVICTVYYAALLVLPVGRGATWTLDRISDPPPSAIPCPALSRQLLQEHALNNTVLVTVVDRLIMQKFGISWLKNLETAGITYGFIAALDPWTSQALGHAGMKQCFNAPSEHLQYKGTAGEQPAAAPHPLDHMGCHDACRRAGTIACSSIRAARHVCLSGPAPCTCHCSHRWSASRCPRHWHWVCALDMHQPSHGQE
jgi:hypothetical protein